MKNNNPFDHNYFIGYISQVFPDFVRVHFPSSVLLNKFIFSGEEFNGGLVGNYITIEGENHGFLGKILELSLPEKERLVLNENAFQQKDFHPIGKIEILLSFDYFNINKVNKGLSCYPSIGSKVFVCASDFIQKYFRGFGLKESSNDNAPLFDFGRLTSDNKTTIEVAQQALFGRHCAIVGTTGGGKSWTVSKCLEETIKNNCKAIIVDATGEYSAFDRKNKVSTAAILGVNSFFHYSNLSVEDIFVLLKPAGQVQAPKLLDAIKSLKILNVLEKNIDNDSIKKLDDGSFSIKISENFYEEIRVNNRTIKKEKEKKRPFNRIYRRFINEIESEKADFNILALSDQITAECVYDNESTQWAGKHDGHLNNCIGLILRSNSLLHNQNYDNIFGLNKTKSDQNELIKNINDFLENEDCLLRISFESVGFDFQIREILANAIGKFLLLTSRTGKFKPKPLVLFVDEAHQYLNKHVKDEYFELTRLNSFDQIAKECRKYGLFLCLSTQMPRDIPPGTLSQMGTFIVHRLINPYDKESIENACSSASKNSLSFLPILGEGEAILMGVDFPMPVLLKINKPSIEPNSKTPQFLNLVNSI